MCFKRWNKMKRELDLSQRHPPVMAEVFEVQRVFTEHEPRSSVVLSGRLFPRQMWHPSCEWRILLSSEQSFEVNCWCSWILLVWSLVANDKATCVFCKVALRCFGLFTQVKVTSPRRAVMLWALFHSCLLHLGPESLLTWGICVQSIWNFLVKWQHLLNSTWCFSNSCCWEGGACSVCSASEMWQGAGSLGHQVASHSISRLLLNTSKPGMFDESVMVFRFFSQPVPSGNVRWKGKIETKKGKGYSFSFF